MDTKSLNTRKSELIAQQESVLNAAHEAHLKLTDAQEAQFTAATAEIHDIDQTLVRLAAIAKGKAEVNAPTSDLFVAQEARTTKNGKKTFSHEYHDAFWSSIRERKFTMGALNEGTARADTRFQSS